MAENEWDKIAAFLKEAHQEYLLNQKTIADLTKELDEKKIEIETLRQEIDAKDLENAQKVKELTEKFNNELKNNEKLREQGEFV